MNFVIISLIYLLTVPVVIGGLFFLESSADKKKKQAPRKLGEKFLPTLKVSESLSKTFKYVLFKHSKRFVFLGIFISGLFVSFLIVFLNSLYGYVASFFLPLFLFFLLNGIGNKEYTNKIQLINNLLTFKKVKMGMCDDTSNVYDYKREFEITDWQDVNVPSRIVINVPVSFGNAGRNKFLGDFCEKFTFKGYWELDKNDGWDDENQTVTLVWKKFLTSEKLEFVKSFLEFKAKTMGLSDITNTITTYYNEVFDIEWGEDKLPVAMSVSIPIGYNILMKDVFLDKLSTEFGRGRPWEVDDSIEKGWDSDKRIAKLRLQQPLPDLALWDEKYIKNNLVQWSFFPLGIGSRGGVPFMDPETKKEVRLVGFDVNGQQSKYMKKQGMVVGKDLLPSPHALGAGVTGGGKSVVQRNIILSCLMRSEKWFLMIVDMKKVEGAMWRKYGVPVATTYEDSACLLSYAQTLMMERFITMESRGINNWADMPKEQQGQAIMINIDEIAELLAPIKGKSDEDKANAEYQAQCLTAIESIARLGRAAQVHLVCFGQRPDSTVVSMQIRQNSPTRLACGALPATISQMVFEGNFGATVPASPQGRIGIRIHSVSPFKAQGFFADEKWFDEYLAKHNLDTNVQGSSEMTRIFEENKQKAKEEDELLGSVMTEEEYDLLMNSMK